MRSRNNPTTVVRKLRWLRAEALGEPAPAADLGEIDEALLAAEAGDRAPIDSLVSSGRLEPRLAAALLQRASTHDESASDHASSGDIP
jgi:hypothetical protein